MQTNTLCSMPLEFLRSLTVSEHESEKAAIPPNTAMPSLLPLAFRGIEHISRHVVVHLKLLLRSLFRALALSDKNMACG